VGGGRRERRSVRLPAFDYRAAGAYFVTICTHHRRLLFEDKRLGLVASQQWVMSRELRPGVELDAFVVMPNHVHGIVWLPPSHAGLVGAQSFAPLRESAPRIQPRSLGSFVRGYKAAVTREINAVRGTPGAPVWQRNYYEHVIRNDADFDRVRRYIEENPLRWAFDRENVSGAPDRVERDFWASLS
jgi:putative transposase